MDITVLTMRATRSRSLLTFARSYCSFNATSPRPEWPLERAVPPFKGKSCADQAVIALNASGVEELLSARLDACESSAIAGRWKEDDCGADKRATRRSADDVAALKDRDRGSMLALLAGPTKPRAALQAVHGF